MAFLGKISAVVAANTSDFSRNIKNAKKDLNNFAASMRGVQLKLDTQSLSGTLTKVQQFQAKIASIRKLLAQGVDAGLPDPGRLQSKFKAFEDLGKPIVSLVKQFEGFSTTIQAELLPELEKAQKGFRRLYNDIDAGTTTFDQAGARIDVIRRQIQGLRQAFAAAGDIGGLRNQLSIEKAGASFFQPNAKESLQESLRLRGEAEKVPAKFRVGAFGQLAFQAEKNADTIEKQAARVAKIQLEIARDGETPNRLDRLAAAQERLNKAVERQGQINNAFRGRLGVVADAQSAGALSERFAVRSDLRTQSEVDQEQIRRSGGARLRLEGRAGGLTAAKTQGLLLQEQMASSIVPEFSSLQARAAASGDQGFISRIEGLRKNLIEMQGDLKAVENAANFNEAQAATDKYTAKLQGVRGELKKVAADLKTAETASRRFEKFIGIAGAGENRLGADFERAASDVSVARQLVGNFEKDAGRDKALQGIERATDRYRKLLEIQQKVFDDKSISPAKQAAALDKIKEKVKETRAALVGLIAEQSKAGGGAGLSVERIEGTMARAAKNRGSFNIAGMASAQLAMQQGLFAIDDFMSSTGGLEYKLRAIGNNITQLGLMLGQSGLIPGLSATAGLFVGLAAVMGGQVLAAFIRFANNSEKAKYKLEALNEAIKAQRDSVRELASAYDSLASSMSSGISSRGKALAQRGEGTEKATRASREGREAFIAMNDKAILSLRTKNAELKEKMEKSDDPTERAGLAAQVKRNQRRERRLREELGRESLSVFGPQGRGRSQATIKDILGQNGRAGSATSTQGELELDAKTRRRQSDPRVQAFLKQNAATQNELVGLRQGLRLSSSQGDREQQLAIVNKAIESMALTKTMAEDAGLNPAKIEAFEQEIVRLQRVAASLAASLEPAFREAEGQLIRGAFKLTDRLGSAQSIIEDAFGGDSSSSAIAELLDNANRTITGLMQSRAEARTPEEVRAIDENIRGLESQTEELKEAAMATKVFSDALQSVSASIDRDVSSLQSREEDARRSDILLGTTESDAQRRRTKEDAEAAGRERRRVEADLDSSRERFEQQAIDGDTAIGRDIKRRREIDEQLAKPVGAEGGTPEERARLRQERAALDSRIESEMSRDPAIREAERRRDAATRRTEEARAADRGRSLGMSRQERSRLEIGGGVNDLRLAMSEETDPSGRQSLANEGAKNLARQFAPMVMQFANERQTADLKGPSRAALQASDITTQQGRSELNRLLRGDDANRDVNLIELQEQTKKLGEIVDAIRNSTGVVVEF